MKNILTPLTFVAIAFISCKNETETQPPKAVVPFYQVANQQQNQTLQAAQPNQGQSLYPAPSAQNNTNQTQTVTTPIKIAKGLNPQHGQPGHRCDIPVGAPLNTPAVAQKTTSTVQSKPTVTVNPTTTVTTPKGMNPPHGQPGHRCEIPVGAPLNSPIPATTTTQTETTPQAATTPKLLSTDTNSETPSNP